jgi:hypothetical protein
VKFLLLTQVTNRFIQISLEHGVAFLGFISALRWQVRKHGWVAQITVEKICEAMVENGLDKAKRHALLKGYGMLSLLLLRVGNYTTIKMGIILSILMVGFYNIDILT